MPRFSSTFYSRDLEGIIAASRCDLESCGFLVASRYDRVFRRETKHPMATYSIPPIRRSRGVNSFCGKLSKLSLTFYAVVAEFHPLLAKIIFGHTCSIIRDVQNFAIFGR